VCGQTAGYYAVVGELGRPRGQSRWVSIGPRYAEFEEAACV
jgi:hypothetical protein